MTLRIGAVRLAAGCALATLAVPAWAGDAPLYQPAPAWVTPATADLTRTDPAAPAILLYDMQQRIEKGRVWSYLDTATRATSAEQLAQMGTVAIPWMPDKGDLIVHRAEIVRGTIRIDLLAQKDRFTVLRREQGLEQRMLSGMLTGTMTVQGLQVGDVLRVTLSVTQADTALDGRAQTIAPLLFEPLRVGQARVTLSWPAADAVRWRSYAEGPAPVPKLVGGYREITIPMPLAKPSELPTDAPGRFLRPPIVEATTFADWADVSRVHARLFATDGLIAPGSPLAAEVARIAAASTDPTVRAAQALELVQDKVRYLLMGMNGGNYVPQSPAQTWDLRYGDCKAKTLLLLAMLRSLGIEAEAVLASSANGGLVDKRLPMPGAFDHVLVRATIAGRSLWLDGTKSGTRLADLDDTPGLYTVLPLRSAGAALMPVAMHADARADVEVTTDYDHTAGIDVPAVVEVTIVMRGQTAALLNAGLAQTTAKQKTEILESIVRDHVGQAQFGDSAMRFDPVAGTATVTASAVVNAGWEREDLRYRRSVDRSGDMMDFTPDRARPAWREIPVATQAPSGIFHHTRLRLPEQATGFALEGDIARKGVFAGVEVARTATLAGGIATIDERIDSTGAEIAPTDIPAERARVALAKTRLLRVVAPADVGRRWQVPAAERPARYRAIEAIMAKAIARAEPDDVSAWQTRAMFRTTTFDRRGAIADWTRVIAIGPTAEFHLRRANLYADLGDTTAALADAEAALGLEPASNWANMRVARFRMLRGDAKGARAVLQERIDLGGKDGQALVPVQAEIMADAGDAPGAIAALDTAVAAKPGSPDLLNMRCWIKGTRQIALDTALKDCTKAIELSDNPANALDSRAVVYFRMGRMDDARTDLDAALDADPAQASSLYLRGIILAKSGIAGADRDIAGARTLDPQIDHVFASYGIKP